MNGAASMSSEVPGETPVGRSRFSSLIIAACALATACALAARQPQSANTNGSYKVVFAGAYEGRGNAAVGAQSVTITGQLIDQATGTKSNFVAPNLSLTNGRFRGSGKVGQATVTVSGRIEEPDGTLVKVARILANFSTPPGAAGRIVGEKDKP
jgi:hypothetical protein